ncbi:MAG: [protein-PII] uridylyltransferase [Gammaproteobacteria bacterium]|nr:[protein-PII] uridylyltransferase [Gammaproteobacteria bacterium]
MPARALIEELPARLAAAGHTASAYAQLLREGQAELKTRFEAEESIESLVHARAQLVDAVLREIWRERLPGHDADWALVAVGGYGRGELQPCSDVDILTLVPAPLDEAGRAALERFVTFLWDVGIEIGHSVRTIDECRSEAAGDVSIMTTLIEARRLAGSAPLVEAMLEALAPAHLWPVKSFFEAKVREQADRHAKANDTAYNLEPNVKTGPGGLRDIQTMGRREDRLLFDHQMKLARLFGYEDATFTLAVEQFMQRYYRTVLDVSLLNELLLQLFREAILDESAAPQPLNPRFQLTNGYLEALHDDIFVRQPSTLLEVFALLQQNPDIRGVRAHTIRAIVQNLWLIDEEFRQNPRNHRLFLEILRAPAGVTNELRRMNTYGVLGRYIPSFGRVVGRMQYDLFHAYTVDAHTLFVVSNLRRLALPRFNHELPNLSQIMQSLPRPEVAYLAALFHDIAKGRGGDHSELGSVDAESFCLEQGLSRYDARLVAWLVRNHLQLSLTAQKQDISDPKVINEFARFVGDETHLDYLYVLTAADVRATNPRLWNSWKASLFSEFHERVKRALRRGLETPVDQEELKQENQTQARELLAATGVNEESVDLVWGMLSDAYFLRHTPQEIAWHTRVLAERDIDADDPVVSVQAESERGTTSIMTFAPHRQHGFARTTAVLDQLGFNIVDARITPTGDGNSIDLYHVLEEDGTPIADAERHEEIELALRRSLAAPRDSAMGVSRRAPRQVRLFNTRTQIVVTTDERNHRSVLEIIAADRPGLLCDIGKVMMDERIDLLGAKIMTVGERAEDVFYVSDSQQGPLADERAQRLVTRLTDALDQRRAA